MVENQLAYLERRAVMEAQMAERAKCPAAVRAHYEMCKAYTQSAEALRQQNRPPAYQRHG